MTGVGSSNGNEAGTRIKANKNDNSTGTSFHMFHACFTHVSRAERVPATDTRDSQHPPHQRRAAAAFAARAPAGKNGGYGR